MTREWWPAPPRHAHGDMSSLAPHERLPEVLFMPREKTPRAPQPEETHEMPPSSRDEGLLFLPDLETWTGKIPWRRKWHPTPVFLPGELHGQRSLACYSPWGCKESDTTEQLSFTHSYIAGRFFTIWTTREALSNTQRPIGFLLKITFSAVYRPCIGDPCTFEASSNYSLFIFLSHWSFFCSANTALMPQTRVLLLPTPHILLVYIFVLQN